MHFSCLRVFNNGRFPLFLGLKSVQPLEKLLAPRGLSLFNELASDCLYFIHVVELLCGLIFRSNLGSYS